MDILVVVESTVYCFNPEISATQELFGTKCHAIFGVNVCSPEPFGLQSSAKDVGLDHSPSVFRRCVRLTAVLLVFEARPDFLATGATYPTSVLWVLRWGGGGRGRQCWYGEGCYTG